MASDEGDYNLVKGVAPNGSILNWVKLKLLGKGSFGVVHLVAMTPINADDQCFAVKSSPSRLSASLEKELQVLKEFKGCRNIVQCYPEIFKSFEYGYGKPVNNLILEFAPGGTLLDLIRKNYGGKIPEPEARNYTRMLVKGICDIHKRGWVHCDLKPSNILVYPSEYHHYKFINLKIADFGLARRPGEEIPEPDLSKGPWRPIFPGTAVYMPPEAVNAAKIHGSIDIWSLGCIVLQMISGRLPWEYKDKIDLVFKLVSSKSPPKIPEGMSREGVDFLMKCFARDPSERWTTEMLLCHPFLLPDVSYSLFPPQTKALHHAKAYSSFLRIY